jgi:hypothetical protein
VRKLNYTEPAVLRGIITAVLALAAAIGFVIPANLSGVAEGLIPVAAFLVPLVQALFTRKAVVSPATADQMVAQARGKHEAPAVS